MACATMSIPTSPVAAATKDLFKEHTGLHRSHSSKDLCPRPSIRRSYSDNHLCHSINRIQATSTQPKLKNSHSMGIFPFQLSGSIIPNSLRSFLFDPETDKDMNIVEKDMNIEENSVDGSEGEEIKRSNWMERLLEIRSHWRKRQQNEGVDEDGVCEEDENGDCDCDEGEGGCAVGYSSGEDEEVGYDQESFSRLLGRVPWPDTKLFSQLAFLSNMAYVISEIKVCFLLFFSACFVGPRVASSP